MKINKWSVSLLRSVDWNLKGHYVSATDRLAVLPQPPLEVVAVAGIRRFPYDLAKQIGTYLEQEDQPPPAMKLKPPVPPNCLLCGHPSGHMAGCPKQ